MSSENTDFEKMTVPDLKSILASKGLPTSGRKLDLIMRIKASEKKIGEEDNEDRQEDNLPNDGENLTPKQSTFPFDGINITDKITIHQENLDISFNEAALNFEKSKEIIGIEQSNAGVDIEDIKTMDTNVLENMSNSINIGGDNEEFFDDTTQNDMEVLDNVIDVNHNGDTLFDDEKENDEEPDQKEALLSETKIQSANDKKSSERMDVDSYRKNVRKRTVYIRNLYDNFNDDIKEMMKIAETYSCRFSKDHENPALKSGYLEIKFATVDEAKDAVEKLKDVKIHDKEIDVRHHFDTNDDHEDKPKPKEIDSRDLKTIYIGNLPTSATKEMLKVIFSDAKAYEMPLDNTGKPKGHAYLEYETEQDAKTALETYAGVKIDDGENTRQLILMLASEYKKEREKSRERKSSKRHSSRNRHDSNNRGWRNKMSKHEHDRYDRRSGGNYRDSGRGYNGYKDDWKSRGSSSHQGLMSRVNPQTAMNLLVGVSQLLTQQQQQHHQTTPNMLSSVIHGGPRSSTNFDNYGNRGSGGGGRRRFDNNYNNDGGQDRRYSGGGGGGGRGGPSRRGYDRRY